MDVKENISKFRNQISDYKCTLVAIGKTKPAPLIKKAFEAGQRDFGENKVQEMTEKHEQLPYDIRWHMVGHLQRNKVKYIVDFVHLIHSVDSPRLLREINKRAKKVPRKVDCLLQVHIAEEESKYGFSGRELIDFLNSDKLNGLNNVQIIGLMGMASFTDNRDQVRKEFRSLKSLFDRIDEEIKLSNVQMKELSMGMTNDYDIALEEGSTMIRIGTAIFGERDYH